jgi:hypothetical protein
MARASISSCQPAPSPATTTHPTPTTPNNDRSTSGSQHEDQPLVYVEESEEITLEASLTPWTIKKPHKHSTIHKDEKTFKQLSSFQGKTVLNVDLTPLALMNWTAHLIKQSILSFNKGLGHTLCSNSLLYSHFACARRILSTKPGFELHSWNGFIHRALNLCTVNNIPKRQRNYFTLKRSDLSYILHFAPRGAKWFPDFNYQVAGAASGIRHGCLSHQVFRHIANVKRVLDPTSQDYNCLAVQVVSPFMKLDDKLDESHMVWLIGDDLHDNAWDAPNLVYAMNECCIAQTGVGLEDFWASPDLKSRHAECKIAPLVNGDSFNPKLRELAMYANYPADFEYSMHSSIRQGFTQSAAGNISSGVAKGSINDAGHWRVGSATPDRAYGALAGRINVMYVNRIGANSLGASGLTAERVPYSTIPKTLTKEQFQHAMIKEDHPFAEIKFLNLRDIDDCFAEDCDLPLMMLETYSKGMTKLGGKMPNHTDVTQAFFLTSILVLQVPLLYGVSSRQDAIDVVLKNLRTMSRPSMRRWIGKWMLMFVADGKQTWMSRCEVWGISDSQKALKAENEIKLPSK